MNHNELLEALAQLLVDMNTRKGCNAELHYNGMMCEFILSFTYEGYTYNLADGKLGELIQFALDWWNINPYKELPSVYD